MGEIVKMTCRNCGKSYQCRTGAGMEHGRLETVIKSFDEATRQSVMRCVEGQKFPMFSFSFQPMYCENCNAIASVPVLKLLQENVQYVGGCQECQAPVDQKLVKEPLHCPACKSGEFDTCREGYWD